METDTRHKLEQISNMAAGAYAQTANELLSGALAWPQDEIDRFIDGYFNDPYLTRNN